MAKFQSVFFVYISNNKGISTRGNIRNHFTNETKRYFYCTNIAEGTSRNTKKDKAYFLTISYSSAMETINHLIIAKDLNYLTEENYLICRDKIEKICNQINNLKKYYLTQTD